MLAYTATAEMTGKPVGQDLREHKVTLPLIAAVPHMSSDERKILESLMANPTPDDSTISEAIEIVDSRGGVTAARERALDMAHRAAVELEKVPPCAAREALRASITYCVERSR
jgi:octaprenyl-diphosphate synthase